MPILFKQHQRLQSSQRFTPDRPQPRHGQFIIIILCCHLWAFGFKTSSQCSGHRNPPAFHSPLGGQGPSPGGIQGQGRSPKAQHPGRAQCQKVNQPTETAWLVDTQIFSGKISHKIFERQQTFCWLLQDPKLLCQLVKYIYKRRHLNHLIPLIFVMLYMLIGAFLFNWLETAAEKDRILAKWAEENFIKN
jgi:hypothetical protein